MVLSRNQKLTGDLPINIMYLVSLVNKMDRQGSNFFDGLSASKRYVEIKRSCNHFANCEEK
jgi:hypothetical protein